MGLNTHHALPCFLPEKTIPMIVSHKFTSRLAALASPFALLTSTALFPTAPAIASEPQSLERAAPIATAATARASETIAKPDDPHEDQGQSILEAVRQNVELLVSKHRNLQTRVSSLAADLEREKSRMIKLLSERDQALLKVTESSTRITRLEARWKAAQDALIVERKRHKAVQQNWERTLSSLRSELSSMRQERDTLKAELDHLLSKIKPAPDSEAPAEAAPEAAQTRPTIPTAPSEPLQLSPNSGQRLAKLDQTQQLQPVDEKAQRKFETAAQERTESFLAQHRPTLQKAQDRLRSVDRGLAEARSRLMNARAAIDDMRIPPNSDQHMDQKATTSIGELAARIDETTKEISNKDSALNELSLQTAAISKAFNRLQEQARRLDDQQRRVKSEAHGFTETEEQLSQRFDDVRKRTLELETAAEFLRIRQVFSDFKMGRVGRAALAQHESTLQRTATNLNALTNQLAKVNQARDGLLIRGDSLRGQIDRLHANRNQLTEAASGLRTRVEAWFERARSAHIPPLHDLVAIVQDLKRDVRQRAAARSAMQALAERLNKTLKRTEADVRAVSTVLRDRHESLHDLIERLSRLEADAVGSRHGHMPHPGVPATGPGPRLVSCGPSSNEQGGDNTSVAKTQANPCQKIHRFLKDVGHARKALAARLQQMTKLLETADALQNDLRGRETAIAQMGRVVAKTTNRIQQDQMGRVEHLDERIASLSEEKSAHDRRISEQSRTVAALHEQLTTLTNGLTKAADAKTYPPNSTGMSTADLAAKEISLRLGKLSDRVEILQAAVVALKRPPPPPAKSVAPPPKKSAEPDHEQRRVTAAETTSESAVRCLPALPSCRRWLYLREQRALKDKGARDD
jgi:chromosome segregation ATPase